MVGSGDDRDGRDRALDPRRPDGDERGPADRPTLSLDAVPEPLSESRHRDILLRSSAGPDITPAAALVEREIDRAGRPGRR